LTDAANNLRKTQIKTDLWIPSAGLAALGVAQLGLSPSNLLTLYLLEPDGATLVDGAGVSFLNDTRPIGRKPSGAKEWFRFPTPTRGQANLIPESSPPLKLNEIHVTKGRIDWIELYNPLASEASVEGLGLSIHRDLRRKIALSG